jgi:hypothetical protein
MKKRPNKSSAVRQQRGPKVHEADDPQTALYRVLNYYPTPPWAARAGAEILLKLDPEACAVWEPACGEGHMAAALDEYFRTVHASDIHAHGYGDVVDFLMAGDAPGPVDWVVTNPPFDRAEQFLAEGLRRARRGVALLCRVAFLEGKERYSALFEGPNRLTLCAVFSDRVSMVLGQWDPVASQASCHAWFFFLKGAVPMPITAIPPGTKARLHRPADARRFAKESPAPLLDVAQ